MSWQSFHFSMNRFPSLFLMAAWYSNKWISYNLCNQLQSCLETFGITNNFEGIIFIHTSLLPCTDSWYKWLLLESLEKSVCTFRMVITIANCPSKRVSQFNYHQQWMRVFLHILENSTCFLSFSILIGR